MRGKQQGFTLFEVLISMFIAGVAVLGLAMLEIQILKSSSSSFHYTVASIQANSFVDSIWGNICEVQTTPAKYHALRSAWLTDVSSAGFTASVNSTFSSAAQVTLSWSDTRFQNDAANNTLTLLANFPIANMSAGAVTCTP